jgi:hypothetical protein
MNTELGGKASTWKTERIILKWMSRVELRTVSSGGLWYKQFSY